MKESSLYIQALQEVFDVEFENEMNSLDSYDEHVFTQKHNKKMGKLIKRQRKPYFKLISTAGRRAACIVVAIIVFSTSALSVKAIREAVYDFIVRIFFDHNVVTTEYGTDSGYPEKIEEEYFISSLPDNFEQTQYGKTDRAVRTCYENNDGYYVLFNQTVKSDYTGYFDNEHSESFNVEQDRDGQEYMVVEIDGNITLIWDNGEYILQLTSNLDKNECLELCKSTKIKN